MPKLLGKALLFEYAAHGEALFDFRLDLDEDDGWYQGYGWVRRSWDDPPYVQRWPLAEIVDAFYKAILWRNARLRAYQDIGCQVNGVWTLTEGWLVVGGCSSSFACREYMAELELECKACEAFYPAGDTKYSYYAISPDQMPQVERYLLSSMYEEDNCFHALPLEGPDTELIQDLTNLELLVAT